MLFDRSATAKHLHAITLLDENGIVRLDSRQPFPEPVSHADRDYFTFHKENPGQGCTSAVLSSRTSACQVSASRGGFRMRTDRSPVSWLARSVLRIFTDLFKDSLGPNDNITLTRTDGTLLMRWPFQQSMLGANLKMPSCSNI